MEPRGQTVKELITWAKDAAELMVDLAYAAVFFDDHQLAREVMDLEEGVNELVRELRLVCLVAARTRDDAEGLAGVLSLAASIEGIADAAKEIARVVLRDLGVPRQLREDLQQAEEVVARVTIGESNDLEGQSLGDLVLPAGTGMWVIAIRRGVDWLFGPDGTEVLQRGDILILQGPPEGLSAIRELAGSSIQDVAGPPVAEPLSNLDRAVDLVVELKDSSEIAVGLAYSAILLRDRGLAAEVATLEEQSDDLYHQLEEWVLRAAAESEAPEELRGLIHISSASERIVDSARSMTRLIERDELPHPIIASALAETDEIVAEAVVAEDSEAEGKTLADLQLHTETGMEVVAIQRGGRWLYRPRSNRTLQRYDRILAIGPEEGATELRALCGDVRPRGEEGWTEAEESQLTG